MFTASNVSPVSESQRCSFRSEGRNGFAIIVTVSIMVLLAVVAIGLLSLSSVAVRSSGLESAQAAAQANARLALTMALAELQKNLGDDRRITADGSIIDGAEQQQVVGVWESWSPRFAENSTAGAPDYDREKANRFVRWLVSGEETELSSRDWVKAPASTEGGVELFSEEVDGFSMAASTLDLTGNGRFGAMAWAVSQENTKAKVTVAGPELAAREGNDDLQAQPRPSLALTEEFGQPEDGWNQRSARVLDFNQAQLDGDLRTETGTAEGRAHFTTSSAGLLTNVVEGGLKTDMSLGFEMSLSDFEASQWTSDGKSLKNPFHAAGEVAFSTPGVYRGQRPLYQPLSDSGTHEVQKSFWPADVHYHFPVTSVPTFHSLRSFYRTPYHLYESGGELTVFEREADHVAGKPGGISRNFYEPPSASMDGNKTQLGIRPVMDRVMFLISGGLSDADELRLVLTPVITMWNPYNKPLEIEGAVAYAWIDVPYELTWKTFNGRGRQASNEGMGVSHLLGHQFIAKNHGRSVDPYFFAAITATGEPLSSSGTAEPIRFEPGEVRVFAPAEQNLKEFDVGGSIRDRTVFLRPVDSLEQFSTKGGFSIPTRNSYRNQGFIRKLPKDGSAQLTFKASTGEDYPFYISLEDATRAKGSNPDKTTRGKAIADVLANNFSQSGEIVQFQSPRVSYAELKRNPVPVGVLESYHRVTKGGGNAQISDVVYTGNPRQPWMNPFISDTAFKTGPQYESRMRAVTSFNGVLQSANSGRSAYYGSSQTPSGGRTHISLFEVPSAPLLSLAAFQHGDFSATSFSPANQVANSWASAYVPRNQVSDGPLKVDHCYLLNEALWDGWFFSGAAPTLSHRGKSGSPGVWDKDVAVITKPVATVLREFVADPAENPLRNPRMRPVKSTLDSTKLVESLLAPEGCLKIAGELMVDGAFNVNSTSVPAWKAMLAGLRGASFDVDGKLVDSGEATAFPRFRDPVGTENDKWQGYRSLSDAEIETLAEELVEEIRERGPFLSLGEFVNRRVASDDSGLRGALQAAIDATEINAAALEDDFSTESYEGANQGNIVPNNTGVGIPGYLTQADVLKPLASVITVRSDTFTIRSYGDSRDATGKVLAKSWAEATVQRVPEFLDSTEAAHTPVDELNTVNGRFGRRFRVISFRYLSEAELNI